MPDQRTTRTIQDALPAGWRSLVGDATWTEVSIGRSAASVFRLDDAASPSRFLKTEPFSATATIRDEVARLRWMNDAGLPGASLLAATEDARAFRAWLLTSAVPGVDLASAVDLHPLRRVRILADGLRTLHATDVGSCPFSDDLDDRLMAIGTALANGYYDVESFYAMQIGRTPRDLFAELVARRPSSTDLVVTHGDACLPNVLALDGAFSGFVDCGLLAVADRFKDLAMACWSIDYNLGREWIGPFFDAYGLVPLDNDKLWFYQVLNEFCS